MATPAPPGPGPTPRPWRAAAAIGGAVLLALLSWLAWRAASSTSPITTRQADRPPVIRENLLVTAPKPVPAPPLTLPTVDGQRFSLAEARGQVVVVNFWATWCAPCVQEIPSLVQLGRSLAVSHPGKFRIVTVSVDEQPAAVERFFAASPSRGLPPELVVAIEPGGGAVSQAFHCQGRGACRPEDVRYPETYVVDQQGQIVAMVVGYLDWTTPGAQRFLEAVLGG